MAKGSVVTVPLLGLDTKTDDESLALGALTICDNAVFTTPGRLAKRPGLNRLANSVVGGSAISSSVGLATFQNELLHLDGSHLRSWVPSQGRWHDRGRLSVASVTDRYVTSNTYAQRNGDSTYCNGIKYFAYEDSRGGLRMAIKDATTDAVLVSDVSFSTTGVEPRCLTYSGSLPLFTFIDNAFLQCTSVDASGDTFALPTLADNLMLGGVHDVCTDGADLIATYALDAVTGSVTTRALQVPFTSPRWTTTFNVTGTLQAVACFPDASGNRWIVAAGEPNVAIAVLNANGALIAGPIDIPYPAKVFEGGFRWTRVAGTFAGGKAHVFAEEHSGTENNLPAGARTSLAVLTLNGSTISTVACNVLLRNHGLASKPFVSNNEVMVTVVSDSTTQGTFYVVAADGHIASRFLVGDATGVRAKVTLPFVNALPGGTFEVATEREGNVEIDASDGKYSITRRIGLNETSLEFNGTPVTVTLASNLLTAGARGFIYDGNAVYEQGFDSRPEVKSATDSGSPGVITPGTYQYAFTYEWTDNFGQVQSSGASDLLNFNNATGNVVTFVVTKLQTTLKQSVRIVGYRSAVDPDASSGTIILQRFTSAIVPYVNDQASDVIVISDNSFNADVLVAPALYSSTGELADTPIPPCTIVEVFKQRVFCAGLEDPSQLAYSKLANRDGVAVEFSSKLTLPTNAGGDLASGPVTALKAMDDKLIIFKRSSISIIAGDGPDNTGGGSDYGLPQLVSSDVGCTDPRSLVLIPEGVMFDSSDGIYLLDRSMQVSYIGAPVESTNGQRIVGATLTPNTNQARFACSDGPTLVFDYIAKQWSHFTYPTLEGSTVWNDAYVITDTGGRVYVEDPSSFTDAGAPIKLKLRTGWIAGSGILGFSRIRNLWLLGKYVGPHQLVASVEYDGQEGSGYTTTFDSTSIINATAYGTGPYGVGAYGGSPLPYQLGWTLPRQKCRSLRITIEDSQSSGFNQGVQLKAMAIEISAYPGLNRLPSQATK